VISVRSARSLPLALGLAGLSVLLFGPAAAAAATADMAVVKTVNQPAPNVGDTVTFTVTVLNGGPDTATGVSVHDALPAGLSFVSAIPSQGTFDPATGVWTIGTVTTVTPQTLQIQATVASPAVQVNTASVTATQSDPNPGNNSAGATVTPQRADLAVAKSVDVPTPQVGDTVTFTVALTNRGPSAATGVSVQDLLPAGLSFVSATPSQGTFSSITGLWTVGSVPTTTSPSLQIRAKLTAVGRWVNTASIAGADQFDPNTVNNTASVTVPRTPTQTTVSSSLNPSRFGDQLTFTAKVAPTPDGGNVTFSDGGIPLGMPVPVDTATGTATSPPVSSLTAGSHQVVATYSGDTNFLPSASPAIAQVVNPPVPPRLSRMTLSPTVFAAASKGPSALAAARRHIGARVTYTLSKAARVRFRVAKLLAGRRHRLVTLRGSFTLGGRSGRNSFRFTGRLAGHRLRPGRYKLIATPSAGGRAGRPARASFRIVSAKRS
jgi:uncharacterized repeat protein (TIGR01451 family)